jgi:hypothetical protein
MNMNTVSKGGDGTIAIVSSPNANITHTITSVSIFEFRIS